MNASSIIIIILIVAVTLTGFYLVFTNYFLPPDMPSSATQSPSENPLSPSPFLESNRPSPDFTPLSSAAPSPTVSQTPIITPTLTPRPSAIPTRTSTPRPAATPSPTALPTATPRSSQTVIVGMYAISFNPTPLTIKVGDSVRWINQDTIAHQVISDTNVFASGLVPASQSYEFKFNNPGTFPYHCGVHLYMQGTIIVTP